MSEAICVGGRSRLVQSKVMNLDVDRNEWTASILEVFSENGWAEIRNPHRRSRSICGSSIKNTLEKRQKRLILDIESGTTEIARINPMEVDLKPARGEFHDTDETELVVHGTVSGRI